MNITRVHELPEGIEGLAHVAHTEGHEHLGRLLDDYNSGTNKFARRGEALFAGYINGKLAAIGGVNIDPYHPQGETARVRRLYVHPAYRRAGIGTHLMSAIELHAAKYFTEIQLFTDSENASKFYEALGYVRLSGTIKVSHRRFLASAA